MDGRCRACGAAGVNVFFDVETVPVHSNLLYDTMSEALAQPSGQLALGVCATCSFVQNAEHDVALVNYHESYEDSQGHSPRFQRFATELVDHLVATYGLRSKRILEIGCGQGDFLVRLCAAGGNTGVGFDPAYRGPAQVGPVTFRSEFYGPAHSAEHTDFVFLRHTLEHVPDADQFVGLLASNLKPGVPIYVEVPESRRILNERAFWDVYYEHPSYFTAASLTSLFRRHGFEVRRVTTGFDDQYLMLEAIAGSASTEATSQLTTSESVDEVVATAMSFGDDVAETLRTWNERLDAWKSSGSTVIVWGAGSKAVGFLTAVAADDRVAAIVDINPAKHGAFQAGTGHQIWSPAQLSDDAPDVVVVMNPIYLDEIRAQLADLGVTAEVLAL